MEIRFKLFRTQRDFFRALLDPETEQIGYGGARGGGKSYVLRVALIARALQYPGSRHLLLRRNRDDVVKQHQPEIRKLLLESGIPFSYNVGATTFTLPGGSAIQLGFAEYVRHAEKYQGVEYLTVAYDEATQFDEQIYARIGGSTRVAVEGAPKVKKIVTCNPGGTGHTWIKRRFVQPATRDPYTAWIPSRLGDNVVLARRDPGYGERLVRGLPPVMRRQWLDGDWDVSEGQYFSLPAGAIREVRPPYWAKWYAGVDWGYRAAFGVVWLATWRDAEGRDHCHVAHELKQERLELDEQAEAALGMERNLGIRPKVRWADPATSKRLEGERDEAGRTIASAWARYGFQTLAARRHGRVPGWLLLRQMMTPYRTPAGSEHGVLTISPQCPALLQEIQDAVFQSERCGISGDDIDAGCEDHLLDSLRYAVTMVFGMALPEDRARMASERAALAYEPQAR